MGNPGNYPQLASTLMRLLVLALLWWLISEGNPNLWWGAGGAGPGMVGGAPAAAARLALASLASPAGVLAVLCAPVSDCRHAGGEPGLQG